MQKAPLAGFEGMPGTDSKTVSHNEESGSGSYLVRIRDGAAGTLRVGCADLSWFLVLISGHATAASVEGGPITAGTLVRVACGARVDLTLSADAVLLAKSADL